MARLASDRHLRPGGPVRIAVRVVALLDVGGVAVGAHPVPVLRSARPVEPVGRRRRAVRVHMEPALLPDVPSGRERLEPSAREGDQVLLQGGDAEGVGHLVVVHRSVGPLGGDDEPVGLAEEVPGLAPVLERGAVEVAEDGLLGRDLHRPGVVGGPPGLGLLGVTALAPFAPDVGGGGRRAPSSPDREHERQRGDDEDPGDDPQRHRAAEWRRRVLLTHRIVPAHRPPLLASPRRPSSAREPGADCSAEPPGRIGLRRRRTFVHEGPGRRGLVRP